MAEETSSRVSNALEAKRQETSSNLVYSVLYDYCNALINKDVNEKVVLDTAFEILQLWLNGSLKMRKRPTPRTIRRQPKPEAIDAKAASTRHTKKALTDNAVWKQHPTVKQLMFTQSFTLESGYPVKNQEGKIVGVITEKDIFNLMPNDVRLAVSRGYAIDAQYLDTLPTNE